MTADERCDWLEVSKAGYTCRLRNVVLPVGEMTAKCSNQDLSVICVDAYRSLSRGQDSIRTESTDAFPWLIDSATHFENLGETDNAIMAYVKAIDFAVKIHLNEKAYDLFRYARNIFEEGVAAGDASLKNPIIKRALAQAGTDFVKAMRESIERSDIVDMQAELKASILGGVKLRKAEREEQGDLVVVDGRQLYSKKATEYREGAETYLNSGMLENAITFACMAALADLMLGNPKAGLVYLTSFVSESGHAKSFQESACFTWTKLVFRALVSREVEAIDSAQKRFFDIPWSFKDDREFARRVMDSVQRRISQ
ncbi:MAG: hypothetical protein JSW61_11780 [Candidatus Thorarchaeota archaeon]|nr:MAG: hypothetical protein JSW61_11780 [Candidatus Thorarchaeota archaeon]